MIIVKPVWFKLWFMSQLKSSWCLFSTVAISNAQSTRQKTLSVGLTPNYWVDAIRASETMDVRSSHAVATCYASTPRAFLSHWKPMQRATAASCPSRATQPIQLAQNGISEKERARAKSIEVSGQKLIGQTLSVSELTGQKLTYFLADPDRNSLFFFWQAGRKLTRGKMGRSKLWAKWGHVNSPLETYVFEPD